jgi:lipocalin-like protein
VRGAGTVGPVCPRRHAAILALGAMTWLAGCGTAEQPRTIASGLVGTWALVSVEERRPSGETVQWLGPKPAGLLIYDRAGNMSVQIMRDPSLPRASGGPGEGYLAYFGRYEVREREATVVHRVQGSMRPSEIGTEHTRSVRVSGDRLVLGLTATRTLTWQRSK